MDLCGLVARKCINLVPADRYNKIEEGKTDQSIGERLPGRVGDEAYQLLHEMRGELVPDPAVEEYEGLVDADEIHEPQRPRDEIGDQQYEDQVVNGDAGGDLRGHEDHDLLELFLVDVARIVFIRRVKNLVDELPIRRLFPGQKSTREGRGGA